MDQPTVHVPVLVDEVVHWLHVKPGQLVVDGTCGAGGHTRCLAELVGAEGRVIALDRDPQAVLRAAARCADLPVECVQANYAHLAEVLSAREWKSVDAILLDLGMSSDQLAAEDRGFSFSSAGPLDLRFDPLQGQPAWRLLKRLSEEHMAEILFSYGQERYSRRIARRIVRHRREHPVRSAADLAQIVLRAVPPGKAATQRIHPATRTFQALRIAVNEELRWLDTGLQRLPDCLAVGGRMAIISYHSLEDRRAKQAFRDDPRFETLTRRPIRPSREEIDRNPRARSAKLRVAVRVEDPARLKEDPRHGDH